MTFGEKVSNARKSIGISQQALGDRIGVTRRVITSYEGNASRPRGIEGYRRLADALNVNVNYLLKEGADILQHGSCQSLVNELTGLFAGGSVAEEDMDEMMLALQSAYVMAKQKKRNKV